MKKITLALSVMTLAVLTGCASDPYYGNANYNPNYNSYNGGNYSQVDTNGYRNAGSYGGSYPAAPVYSNSVSSYNQYARPARIEDVRFIPGAAGYNNGTIGAPGGTSGTGAVIGAVAGGVLGNAFGHGGGRAISTVIGAVGGGYVGNAVERGGNANSYNRSDTAQIQLRMLDNNELLNVTQPYSGEDFRPGRRVQLVNIDGRWIVRN